MALRNVVLLLLFFALGIFVVLNWSVIMAPTRLSVGFAEVVAPLGLVMLGMLAVLTVVFLLYIAYLQASVLAETRRHARELEAQRHLADQAEASRFTELRAHLDRRIDEVENSLAAHLGELRDERVGAIEPSRNQLTGP